MLFYINVLLFINFFKIYFPIQKQKPNKNRRTKNGNQKPYKVMQIECNIMNFPAIAPPPLYTPCTDRSPISTIISYRLAFFIQPHLHFRLFTCPFPAHCIMYKESAARVQ